MSWIIVNKTDRDLVWSNSWGWVTEDYDSFTDAEHGSLDLPIDGEWQRVPWAVAS